jgi:2-polyprenyl-6-methoxyphenol hydroxylase-like FAD-dependent oxidoreductase
VTMGTTNARQRSALISGASIAGPALAYWLDRYGFETTVVEKSSSLRDGGYPIDVRGTAVDAATRMGMLDAIRDAHIDTQRISFLDAEGNVIGRVRPESVTGGVQGRDFELRRGDLATALAELTSTNVEYIFGDSIASIEDRGDRVDVTFDRGPARSFDLVFGADGLHSNVRRLVFGPESDFHRYLGWCFAGFTLPNQWNLSHETLLWNTPGRMATLYAVGDHPERVYGFLSMACPQPPYETLRDEGKLRQLLIEAFQDQTWDIPILVSELEKSTDSFCDSVSQISMPCWSKGRVALVGDAAHATSFLSGQGSSCSLVTPYVLAGELATKSTVADAFSAYESITRSFVEENQAIAHRNTTVCVAKPGALRIRNFAVKWIVPALIRLHLAQRMGGKNRRATTALQLPLYDVGGPRVDQPVR